MTRPRSPARVAEILGAAGTATGAGQPAAQSCRALVVAATSDDNGRRLARLAAQAAADPETAAAVIRVLAASAAVLAEL